MQLYRDGYIELEEIWQRLSGFHGHALVGQAFGNLPCGFSEEEHSVNASDQLCLFGIDDKIAVFSPVVSEESAERNRHLSVGEPLALFPCAVLLD